MNEIIATIANHAEQGNVMVEFVLVAARDIAAGDELNPELL